MKNIQIIEEINEGGDVYLRKISSDDANFFFESLREEVISRYLSLGPLVSQSYSKKLLKKYQKFWTDKTQFNYVIEHRSGNDKKNNNIKKVGAISLWRISWLHNRAEIGIWITPKYWNMGYAKKVLNLIKIVGFVHLKLNRLEAHIAVENKRSINLFIKTGFIKEGTLKQYLILRGTSHDAVVLSYLKENWNGSERLTNE